MLLSGNPWVDLVLKAVLWGLAVYLAAYFASKAQHRAIAEDLKHLIVRAQEEAEAKKRGETEAVRKDMQLILDQLHQTTALTKQIEADITYKAWDRQMRVNLKRDLYIRLLEAMAEKVRTLRNLATLEANLKDPRFEPDRREARQKRHRELCDASEELTKKVQAAVVIAYAALPSDATGLLDSLSKRIDEQASRHAISPTREYMLAEAALYKEGLDHLALLAKRDIGDGGDGSLVGAP